MRNKFYRRTFIVVSIFVLALTSSVTFVEAASTQGGLTKIADNVFSYADVKNGSPANSFGANAGIIVGKDGIIVIDTLISAKEAQRFISDIRKVSTTGRAGGLISPERALLLVTLKGVLYFNSFNSIMDSFMTKSP